MTFALLPQSQIEDINSNHAVEVGKLQKHIDDLDNEVIRLQMAPIRSQRSVWKFL